MDSILLITIIILVALIAIIATYFIAKSSVNNKLDKYKSIEEALKASSEEYSKLNEELQIATSKLSQIHEDTGELQALKKNEQLLIKSVEKYNETLASLKADIDNNKLMLTSEKETLSELMGKLDLYSRLDDYVSCGHFEMPQYLYETSSRFAEEIKDIRQQQKDMIKDRIAITYPSSTIISTNQSFNKKVLDGQVKLMLRAFNTDCDFLIGKVKPSSFARTLEQIEKLANTLEKSAASLETGFNIDYIELKFEECKLHYQYVLKKQEEAIEQKLIKEQIREEQRAIKEYEKAISEAEKEEKMYRKLLDKARLDLSQASETEKLNMEIRIAELELQLTEAEAKEQRAKSMAEQTRKGHVYVISNIGSFGEDVYKIGLTRRLEPMDRVKELGDASVPFPFDVHAMIYVDDAPALEAALHREFSLQRVNAVNYRKEFFQIDLDAIREAVERIVGVDAEFKMTALAEDYYESLRLQDAA